MIMFILLQVRCVRKMWMSAIWRAPAPRTAFASTRPVVSGVTAKVVFRAHIAFSPLMPPVFLTVPPLKSLGNSLFSFLELFLAWLRHYTWPTRNDVTTIETGNFETEKSKLVI